MDKKAAFVALDELYAKVDRFFAGASSAQPGALVCAPGCDGCCRVDLTVFEVEAWSLASFLAVLPVEEREAIAERVRQERHCVFLDDQGMCRVYERRPLVCRSHGLAIQLEGRTDYCPLNYTGQDPEPKWVLDVERLDLILVTINRVAGGTGRRVRLADLASAGAL